MRTYVLLAAVLATGLLATSSVDADSATAVIKISATVRKNCLITTTDVAYGSYDPVGANATAPLDATGTVVLTCTKGTTAEISLDGGANGLGSTRRMTNGATGTPEYLTYELYQDNSRATVWNNTDSGKLKPPAAPSKDPRTFTVYGRVPGAQDVPVGSFNDSIVATVNF